MPARAGKSNRAETEQVTEQARAEVARRVHCIHRKRSLNPHNHGDGEANEQNTTARRIIARAR